MSCCVSHRCLTIVMQSMFCQRWTWRVGNSCYIISCYIPAVMGHPKDASGCHCVLLLCHLMYCHLPNSSPWHLRRFTKSPSHSEYHLVLSCHSSVHMAHWKSPNNFPPRLFFHSLCIRSSLHSTRPHRPFVGPGPSLSAASTVAPAARSCSRMAVWPATAAWCSGVQPPAPKGSETSTARGLHPVALHRPPPTAVGETAICRVISFKVV